MVVFRTPIDEKFGVSDPGLLACAWTEAEADGVPVDMVNVGEK